MASLSPQEHSDDLFNGLVNSGRLLDEARGAAEFQLRAAGHLNPEQLAFNSMLAYKIWPLILQGPDFKYWFFKSVNLSNAASYADPNQIIRVVVRNQPGDFPEFRTASTPSDNLTFIECETIEVGVTCPCNNSQVRVYDLVPKGKTHFSVVEFTCPTCGKKQALSMPAYRLGTGMDHGYIRGSII